MNRIGLVLTLLAAPAVGDDVLESASNRFAARNTTAVPDFQRHIVPLMGRLGCNSAKCHGSFQGQGGFRLSLFGFDFQSDHASIRGGRVSRIDTDHPDGSLLVRKPTQQVEHEGGKRFEPGSWEHHMLLRWIQAGGKGAVRSSRPASAGPQVSESHRKLFVESVRPLLEDHCYECHGHNNRKGGLSLSNRQQVMNGGDSGPAIVPGDADASRLIQAVRYSGDLQMPPSGRLSAKRIATLERWVRLGAPWPEDPDGVPAGTNQNLRRLHVEPNEIQFSESGQAANVRVIAEWDSGLKEDVTCLARFQTNDDAVVTVNRDGRALSAGPGDTHIIAFYDNGVAAIPVLRPYRPTAPATPPTPAPQHPIDRLVLAKLQKLNVVPSEICTDTEFLRRVSIDMTGSLPTPEEVVRFVADADPDKRARKIDELLERPIYAAWWANKLCDFTGCSPKSIASLLEVASEAGYRKASDWYDWVYERVQRNEPYDRLVSGIMLADPSGRDGGMPHFWTRQSLKEPKDTATSVAHAFLGIQLHCAECHKHPFDRWTQADYRDFALFFRSVTQTKRRSQASTDQRLSLLRSGTVDLTAGDDPRRPVMDWMRAPNNPWFARAFVNRVWASYFHAGIVDPPDRFTPANPPANPALLNQLTQGFIDSGFDMKWLHRRIATSRTYQRSWKPNSTNRLDHRNFSRFIPRRIPAEVVYDALKQATASSDRQEQVRTDLRRRASGHLSMRMAGTHAMKVFGKPDRSTNCDCERVNEPTLLQAIFTQNDPLLRMRIADSGWILDLEDRVAASESLNTAELIEEAWLRTLSRRPTEQERARATRHFADTSVVEGIRDLMWALFNTKEFLLNH